jgi:uncharacterized protein YbjT (DUF2867 family)
VRGTTRHPARVDEIEAAGLEPHVADPADPGTILDALDGVALVYWLLASATGDEHEVAALHGRILERLLEELVDTPVRAVVYEATGTVDAELLEGGRGTAREATTRWRIPVDVVDADPGAFAVWLEAMVAPAARLSPVRRS